MYEKHQTFSSIGYTIPCVFAGLQCPSSPRTNTHADSSNTDLHSHSSHIDAIPVSDTRIFDNGVDNTLLIYIALADGSEKHLLMTYEQYGFGDWAP